MTGRELHERWMRCKGHDDWADYWDLFDPASREVWDRLAAEVVPVSEVVEWLRDDSEATPPEWLRVADAIEARFAPGAGEER